MPENKDNSKPKEKSLFLKNLFKNNKLKIIPKEIHKVDNSLIDIEAKKVVYRLKSCGYKAYIVGGAIRDLLLGRKPKDFDVATDAKPNEIRKIFCNARLIGRRFKLAHIIFKNKIIEAATFRAEDKNKKGILISDNKFGTIEEDAQRRDFGINALYYDIDSETLLDYVKGYNDIQKKRIRPLKKPAISFIEDPVRMIRAIKYSVLLNCKIEKKIFEVIKKNAKEVVKCSSFRLLEEINKIIKCENTKGVIIVLHSSKLLKYFIPIIEEEINSKDSNIYLTRLEIFDKEKIKIDSIDEMIDLFWAIMLFEKIEKEIDLNQEDILDNISNCLKKYLYVIKVPRKIVESIARLYLNYIKLRDIVNKSPSKEEITIFINRLKRTKYYNLLYYFLTIIGENRIDEFFVLKKNYNKKHKKNKNKKKKYYKMVNTKKKITN